MSTTSDRQHCVVCAWRENCAKKFSVTDGGARCPDFTRDVSVKQVESPVAETTPSDTVQQGKP
jgi:hypothetical protein